MGLVACALLVINNLRDIETDRVAGKRTLAVRLGAWATCVLYDLLLFSAGVAGTLALVLADTSILIAPIVLGLLIVVLTERSVRPQSAPPELIRALGLTARYQLLLAGTLVISLAVSR